MTDTGWRVEIAPAARRDIKRLDKPVQARILTALQGLHAEPARGDITRLTGITPPEWRLRVGDWRVRFNRDHDTRTVLILRVLPRGRAYRPAWNTPKLMSRRLTLLFTALLALLAAAPADALTTPAPGAQNCARAFLSAAATHTPGIAGESPCTRRGSNADPARITAGCCVATKVERFLPDKYYERKELGKAPGQYHPYGRYERFDERGNIKQVTTYDRHGDRARQHDVGPGTRHGEGSHRFDYDENNPRQGPGGGRRSDHEPFGG